MFWGRGEATLMNLKLFVPKHKDREYLRVLKKTKKIKKCIETFCHDDCKKH